MFSFHDLCHHICYYLVLFTLDVCQVFRKVWLFSFFAADLYLFVGASLYFFIKISVEASNKTNQIIWITNKNFMQKFYGAKLHALCY